MNLAKLAELTELDKLAKLMSYWRWGTSQFWRMQRDSWSKVCHVCTWDFLRIIWDFLGFRFGFQSSYIGIQLLKAVFSSVWTEFCPIFLPIQKSKTWGKPKKNRFFLHQKAAMERPTWESLRNLWGRMTSLRISLGDFGVSCFFLGNSQHNKSKPIWNSKPIEDHQVDANYADVFLNVTSGLLFCVLCSRPPQISSMSVGYSSKELSLAGCNQKHRSCQSLKVYLFEVGWSSLIVVEVSKWRNSTVGCWKVHEKKVSEKVVMNTSKLDVHLFGPMLLKKQIIQHYITCSFCGSRCKTWRMNADHSILYHEIQQ